MAILSLPHFPRLPSRGNTCWGRKGEKLGMGHHQEDSPPGSTSEMWATCSFTTNNTLSLPPPLLTPTKTRILMCSLPGWSMGYTTQAGLLTYAVLPASNLTKTRAFAADPEVEVISQTSDLHVVCYHLSQTVGVVVVSSGQVGALDLQIDAPCILLFTLTSHTADAIQLDVTLADP